MVIQETLVYDREVNSSKLCKTFASVFKNISNQMSVAGYKTVSFKEFIEDRYYEKWKKYNYAVI